MTFIKPILGEFSTTGARLNNPALLATIIGTLCPPPKSSPAVSARPVYFVEMFVKKDFPKTETFAITWYPYFTATVAGFALPMSGGPCPEAFITTHPALTLPLAKSSIMMASI